MAETRLAGAVQPIPDALCGWSERTPDASALLVPGREPLSYRDLQCTVANLATRLCERGIGRDDHLLMVLPEGPDLAVMLLAAVLNSYGMSEASFSSGERFGPFRRKQVSVGLPNHEVAAVVPSPDTAPSPRALRAWMLERLAPHKVPRLVWFVSELPCTDTGKVMRHELARRVQEARHG